MRKTPSSELKSLIKDRIHTIKDRIAIRRLTTPIGNSNQYTHGYATAYDLANTEEIEFLEMLLDEMPNTPY